MTVSIEVRPEDINLEGFDVVVDVRPIQTGASIAGSVHAPLDAFLDAPERTIDRPDARVLTVCDVGMRSGLAVRRLRKLGYHSAVSLAGGLDAWRAAGLPVTGTGGLSPADLDRYDRQIKLPDIGVGGQVRISEATVAVVGAGGLGSPVLPYRAAAGVGTLRLIDDDSVEVSNLHRQPIYRTPDEHRLKVEAAADTLAALNPDVVVEIESTTLSSANASELLRGSSVIVDATDRFDARYAINDAAVALRTPLVSASVYRWEGQLLTYVPDEACYRCAFPVPPDSDVVLDCALTGVVGPVVGTVGSMQATEVLQLLSMGTSGYAGYLTVFDGRTAETRRLRLKRRSDCPACGES